MSSDERAGGVFGSIEGGGTKFVCAVARQPDRVLTRARIATRDPVSTLADCVAFFAAAEKDHGRINAIGFGSFGPVVLDRRAPNHGCLLATPKPGWSGVDLLQPFRSAFDVPIALDTDVGAAALAEWRIGAGRGLGSLAYVTVGTGIGGAIVPVDPAMGRLMHAEMGHLLVRRHPADLEFAGVCPFHADCLEGLASGPAIEARWGGALASLAAGHEGVDVIADYLAQLAVSIALMTSVERIVFGGGVMRHADLLPRLRAQALKYLNGYLPPLDHAERAAAYICGPALGDDAGIVGAVLLAMQAAGPTTDPASSPGSA